MRGTAGRLRLPIRTEPMDSSAVRSSLERRFGDSFLGSILLQHQNRHIAGRPRALAIHWVALPLGCTLARRWPSPEPLYNCLPTPRTPSRPSAQLVQMWYSLAFILIAICESIVYYYPSTLRFYSSVKRLYKTSTRFSTYQDYFKCILAIWQSVFFKITSTWRPISVTWKIGRQVCPTSCLSELTFGPLTSVHCPRRQSQITQHCLFE